jgi:hypothetical protein
MQSQFSNNRGLVTDEKFVYATPGFTENITGLLLGKLMGKYRMDIGDTVISSS